MSKDVHNIDELFRSALEEQDEVPSASVKENLFAQLDKRDAASYKKRFIDWRRAAILLLLLLLGFILYDSVIKNTGNGNQKLISNKNDTSYGDEKNITGEKNPLSNSNSLNKKENTTDQADNKHNDQLVTTDKPKNKNASIGQKSTHNNQPNNERSIIKSNLPNQSLTQKTDNSKMGDPFGTSNANPSTNEISIIAKEEFQPQTAKIDFVKITSLPLIDFKLNKTRTLFNEPLINNTNNKNSKRIRHFKPYWLLTGLVTYDQVNYKLDSDVPNAITSIRHQEDHEPSFSISVLAARQFNEKWSLQTGLIYSNVNIGISQQKLVALQDPSGDIAYKYITSSGYAYFKPGIGPPPSFGDVITTEAEHSLHSINVPLMLKYTIGKNKLLLVPGTGFEAGFITGSKLKIEIEDTSNKETVFVNKLSGTKSFYWSFVAEAEIRYGITQRMALSLRPVFRYAISPITENNVVETFPYSFGASLGLTYKF